MKYAAHSALGDDDWLVGAPASAGVALARLVLPTSEMPTLYRWSAPVAMFAAAGALAACGAGDAGDGGATGPNAVGGEEPGASGGGTPTGSATEARPTDATATPAPPGPSDAGAPVGSARAWISNKFSSAPSKTGAFTTRQSVETPHLVKDASGKSSKYAFYVRDDAAPDVNSREVAFVDVDIRDLLSADAYGAGIGTSRSYPDTVVYLANVYVEPNWPAWVSYSSTNYDGIELDAAKAVYGEDVTIKNWNADAAVDNKATISQFVRLTTEGNGHRTMRYWRSGPHYLVDSNLNNKGQAQESSLLWIQDCSTFKVYVYNSKFNGSPTVPGDKIQCDTGSNPSIVYLTQDPRTTGEMHPMFAR